MSTGRYIFRGFAQQGWRAAGRALADSGIVTTRDPNAGWIASTQQRHWTASTQGRIWTASVQSRHWTGESK